VSHLIVRVLLAQLLLAWTGRSPRHDKSVVDAAVHYIRSYPTGLHQAFMDLGGNPLISRAEREAAFHHLLTMSDLILSGKHAMRGVQLTFLDTGDPKNPEVFWYTEVKTVPYLFQEVSGVCLADHPLDYCSTSRHLVT